MSKARSAVNELDALLKSLKEMLPEKKLLLNNKWG